MSVFAQESSERFDVSQLLQTGQRTPNDFSRGKFFGFGERIHDET
jgi:hypothetical protein